jgi:hypothetical protein
MLAQPTAPLGKIDNLSAVAASFKDAEAARFHLGAMHLDQEEARAGGQCGRAILEQRGLGPLDVDFDEDRLREIAD